MKTLDYYGVFGDSLGEKGGCPNVVRSGSLLDGYTCDKPRHPDVTTSHQLDSVF